MEALREHLERADPRDRVEIAVAVQETQVELQCRLSDEAVEGAADRPPATATVEEDPGSGGRRGEGILGDSDPLLVEIVVERLPLSIVSGALEDLLDDDRGEEERRLLSGERLEDLRGDRLSTREEVHQHRRVYEDHLSFRSLR